MPPRLVRQRPAAARFAGVFAVPSDPFVPVPSLPVPVLHVCVSCRAGVAADDPAPRPGRKLFDRLRERAEGAVTLRPVECLARCADGCTAAIAAPGKWSLLMGRLDESKADDLLLFAGSYDRSRTGMVMPSKRPASLSDLILGRIPGTDQGDAA